MNPHTMIARNIAGLRARLDAAARSNERAAGSISLMAVSKFQPVSHIREALECGQRLFGENRVQEASYKFPELRAACPEISLHLIGALQTNKAVEAVSLFDVIQTLDRPRLATALEKAAQKVGRLPELYIQVNTGNEPQKAGIARHEAPAFIEACQQRFGGLVTGVMCVPPVDEDPAEHFRFLHVLARRHGLRNISAGMSHDFETAIAHGSTMIRIGTAIFGPRPAPAV